MTINKPTLTDLHPFVGMKPEQEVVLIFNSVEYKGFILNIEEITKLAYKVHFLTPQTPSRLYNEFVIFPEQPIEKITRVTAPLIAPLIPAKPLPTLPLVKSHITNPTYERLKSYVSNHNEPEREVILVKNRILSYRGWIQRLDPVRENGDGEMVAYNISFFGGYGTASKKEEAPRNIRIEVFPYSGIDNVTTVASLKGEEKQSL